MHVGDKLRARPARGLRGEVSVQVLGVQFLSRVPWAFPRDVFLTSLHRPDALAGAGGRRGPGQGPDVPGQPLRVQRVLAGAPPGEGGRGEDAGQRKGLCDMVLRGFYPPQESINRGNSFVR